MADFSATSRIETPFNAEQLQIYLVEVFDPGFRNFLNDLPELNGDSYTEGGGMEVTSVTSPIVDASCVPSQTASNNCYNIESNFEVVYANDSFSSDYVSLIMASGSNGYISSVTSTSENDIVVQYTGAMPFSVSANITLTLVDVPNRRMEYEEWQTCASIMGRFLRTDYSRAEAISQSQQQQQAGPVISIRNVTFVQQALLGNERMLQGAITNDATLLYSSVISGEYLPPPDISDFGDVVVETFTEENDEFVEVLQPEGNFFAAISSVIATRTSAMGGDGENSSSSSLSSGAVGGIIIGVIMFVVVVGVFAFAKRKMLLKKQVEKETVMKVHDSHLESLEETRVSQAKNRK